MKTGLGFILLILLFISLCGCSDEIPIENVVSASEKNIFTQEYTEISDFFFKEGFIGESKDSIPIPKTNLFMENDNSLGFDYVTMFGMKGNITFTLEEGKVFSATFGSNSYIEKNLYKHTLTAANQKIAKMLNVTLKEFDYVGPEEMDEYESLFSGKGILKSVYETGDTIITLSAIGTNNEAVITVSQILK